MEATGELLWLLVQLVVLHTGKAAVLLVSLGRWRGERIATNEAKIHGLAGALSFVHGGQRVITSTGLMFVGGVFYTALFFGLLVWFARV